METLTGLYLQWTEHNLMWTTVELLSWKYADRNADQRSAETFFFFFKFKYWKECGALFLLVGHHGTQQTKGHVGFPWLGTQ